MRVVVGAAERGPIIAASVLVASVMMLAMAVGMGMPLGELTLAVMAITLLAVGYRSLLQWRMLIGALLLIILLIPIKRYRIPGDLPFELEPYRIAVMAIVAAWISSLLVDPRVKLRSSGFEGPLLLLVLACIGSIISNSARITELAVDANVLKELTFLFSFILVLYIIVSVVRTRQTLDLMLKVLVGGGAIVALLAVIEARAGFNVFDRLGGLPLLEPAEVVDVGTRAGRVRAYASAQHPIALSAALVMLIPLGIYLGWSGHGRKWWGAVALLCLGSLTTMSRTSIVMMLVVVIVFFWLRREQIKRLWPLAIPMLVAVQLVLPGTLGGLRASFFPEGGLIADQSKSVGSRGQGRVADLAPTLDQVSQRPVFGEGYGSRIVDGETPNAQILDNQWLASLLETGLAGGAALLWLFWLAVRRLGKAAKRVPGPSGSLFVALAGATAALSVGMLTFDAFSFIQVTFFLFIVLAFAGAALSIERRDAWDPPARA
jgi:O-antigen ligase/polysaccharide polymerase Wzy-like membrane protein